MQEPRTRATRNPNQDSRSPAVKVPEVTNNDSRVKEIERYRTSAPNNGPADSGGASERHLFADRAW